MVILFLFPYVGALCLYTFNQNSPMKKDFEMFNFKTSSSLSPLYNYKSNFEKDIDIVPIEDVLILNSNKIKRKLLIDTIKNDYNRYVPLLNKALKDDDTETSHYAASALMDIKSKINNRIQELYEALKNDQYNSLLLSELAKELTNNLNCGMMDANSRNKLINSIKEVVDKLIRLEHEKKYYKRRIELDFLSEEIGNTKQLIEEFKKYFKKDEAPYYYELMLCYKLMDKSGFQNTMEKLKKSEIVFSSNMLNCIRLWSGVENI